MRLHELTQIMWHKDITFAECLNNIRISVPEPGSKEDIMLQSCELQSHEMIQTTQQMPCMSLHKMNIVMNGMQED